MRQSKLDAPPVKEMVVKELAIGKSKSSIAEEVGLHRSQVCRFANREDVKELIETEAMRLLEVVPDAVDNIKTTVKGMKNLPKKDIKNRELAYKASAKVLESAGILNTATPSQVIVNIFKQSEKPLISPLVQKVLQEFMKGFKDDGEIKESHIENES